MTPPPGREPLPAIELSIEDQILDLAFFEAGESTDLLVLGRRTLSVVRVGTEVATLQHQVSLAAWVSSDARVDRWGRGCMQFLLTAGPEPVLQIFSTALGTRPVGEAAFLIRGERLVRAESGLEDSGEPGACDAFHTGLQSGWPGRTLVLWSSADALLFHLNRAGRLSVSNAPGHEEDLGRASGDLLAALSGNNLARLYTSSLALPGEPDQVQEYGWTGTDLVEARRSREFDGRLAALVFLPHDERVALAEVSGPETSRLHILSEDSLWQEVLQ